MRRRSLEDLHVLAQLPVLPPQHGEWCAIGAGCSALGEVRGRLRDRLGRQVWRAWRRWLHSTSGRQPDDTVLDTLL